MTLDPCSARLYGGGSFGTWPGGSSMGFPGVDGGAVDLAEDGGGYPFVMWLTRLAP